MEINYYEQTDSLYIDFAGKQSVESTAVSDDIVIDFGENGDPVGIGIEHAGEKLNLSELVACNIPRRKSRLGDYAYLERPNGQAR